MSINVIVNGAGGRMGQEAVIAVENDPHLNLAAALVRGDDLARTIRDTKANVVVDLTTPEVVYENTRAILENSACPVIGTSGLTPAQIEELTHISKQQKLGGVIAPNFCLGVVLMMQAAEKIAAYMPEVEIIEYHRAGKKDAPSATAIKTAGMINNNRRNAPHKYEESNANPRGEIHNDVAIHSVRLPGVIAKQEVIFGGMDETLTISHNTLHRKSFMPGIILSCKKVVDLRELVYGLEHLL
jgi:4-hydroxy-tetrahydrodipicolinate reductase